jgi:TetR/AcrR family transcriptional regulator, transcriptional repressor of aconitase
VPKVTQQHRDARRDQILDAARRCFLRDGFHATSMHDLFAESGLSAGAVYRYFASKDDVIIAIAEENLRDVLATIQMAATLQPGRSVGAVLADVFEVARAKDEQYGLAKLALLTWSETLRNAGLAARFAELFARLHADLAALVRQSQQAGHLTTDLPAEALTSVIISVVPGLLLQLATVGPEAVADAPAALQALWR